jgi:TatD DNase family protein
MTFIDSHSHLYLDEFAPDLDAVVSRAQQAGVAAVLFPNIDRSTLAPMRKVCADYADFCFPMIGLHPTSVGDDYADELRTVEQELASHDDYVAVGEIGLDFYWDTTHARQQIEAFETQLDWAMRYRLPVVIHSRDAFAALCDVLDPQRYAALTGVFHSFTGTADEAAALLRFEGFRLGINGVLTFRNSGLRDALARVPLSRLLIETDAPYLTPVPYRGKRNESAYLIYIIAALAKVYGVSEDVVAEQTLSATLSTFPKLKSGLRF